MGDVEPGGEELQLQTAPAENQPSAAMEDHADPNVM